MIPVWQIITGLPKEDYGIAIAICGKCPRVTDMKILGIGLDAFAKINLEHEAYRKGQTFERALESLLYAAIREHFATHKDRF